MSQSIEIDGIAVDTSATHISFSTHDFNDMAELLKLKQLPNLDSASFACSSLDDTGLDHICRATSVSNLNLQETNITDAGIECLAALPRLRHLRLKENPQLTNACIPFLLALKRLVDLQIHETSINEEGVMHLVDLQDLKDLCVDDQNAAPNILLEVSRLMPNCTILSKGTGEFFQGRQL